MSALPVVPSRFAVAAVAAGLLAALLVPGARLGLGVLVVAVALAVAAALGGRRIVAEPPSEDLRAAIRRPEETAADRRWRAAWGAVALALAAAPLPFAAREASAR